MDINNFTPTGKLAKKHLVSLSGYTEEDIFEILKRAETISKSLSVGEKPTALKNKKIALITKGGLTRWRLAFQTAVTSASGEPVVCRMSGSEVESLIKDRLTLSAILSYGIHALVVQTSEIGDAEAMEKLVALPVVNGYGIFGPLEALSALYTIWLKKGRLGNMKVAVVADPNLTNNELINAFAICGFEITFVCQSESAPTETLLNFCRQFGDVKTTDDLFEGIKTADIIYVADENMPYRYAVTQEKLDTLDKKPLIIHPLPLAENGLIDELVADSQNFCGLDEAINLPVVETAVLSLIVK